MAASSPAEGGIDSFFNQISTAIESIKGLVAPALTGAANSKPGDGGGSGQVAMVEMNSSDMLRSAAASVSGYTQPDELVDTSGDRVPDASRQLAGKGRKKGGSISAPDLKGFSDASDSDTSRHGASDRSNAPGKVQSSSGQSGASGGNGRQASAPVVVAAGATAVAAGAVAPAAARPRSALEEARSFLPAFMLLYEECFGEVDVPMDPLALLMVWTEQKELERQRMEHEKGMAERGITQHLRPPPPLGDLCKAMRHSLATYGNTLNNIRMGKTSMAVHAIHKVVDDVTAAAMGDDAAAERNVTAAATIAGISRRDILSARWASERFLPGGYVAVDHDNKWVVLAVRGSLHITDALTNVHAKSVPFLGGWAHEGMAIAARHTAINHLPAIGDALRQFPDYSLIVTGHSLGGGVAALVAMLLHSNDPCVAQAVFQDDDEAAALRLHPMPAITGVRAFCFAPPCVISNTLAQHCAPYVKSVVCGKDVVPRLSISNFKRLVAQLHGKAPVNKALKAFGGAFGGAFTGAFLAGSSPPTGPSGPPRPKLLATKSARSIGPTSLSNDEEFVQQQQRQRPATGGAARNNSGSSSNNDGEGEGSGHWSGHDDIDRGEGDAPLGMPSLDAVVKMFSRMSPPWATLTFGADEARARDPDGAWSLASTPSSSPPGSGASSPPSSSAFDWRGRGNTLQMEHCLMDGWWEVWPTEGQGGGADTSTRGGEAGAGSQGQTGDGRLGGAGTEESTKAGVAAVLDKPPSVVPSDWGGDLAGDVPFAGDRRPPGVGNLPAPGDGSLVVPRLPAPPAPAPAPTHPSTPGPATAPASAPAPSRPPAPAPPAPPTFAEVVSRAAFSAASAASSVAAAAVTTSIAVATVATSAAVAAATNSVSAAAAVATASTAPAASIAASAAGAAAGAIAGAATGTASNAASNAVAAGAAGAPPLVVAAGASIDAQMEAPLMTGNRHVSMGPSRAESGSTAAMGPLVLVGAGDLAAVAMMPEGGFDEGSAQDGKKDGKRKLETTFPLAGDASGSAAAPSSSRGGGPADSPPCPTCGLRKHPETDAALAAAQRPAGQPVDPGTSAAATTATANNNTNNNTENNSSNTIKAATRKPPAVLGGRALTGDLSNLDDADADTNAGGWWRRKPSPSTPPPSSSSSQPPATSSGAGSGSNTGATATPGVTAPGTPGGDAAAQQAPSYAAAVLGYKSKGPGSPGSRPGSSGGQGRPPLLERSGVLASGPGELGSSSSGKDLAASSMASSSRGSSSQGGDAVRQDDQGELAARAPHVMPPSGLAGICNCDPPGAPTGMLREERAKAQAASRGKAPLAVLKSDRTRFVDQAPDGSVPADSISLESSIMSAQKDLLFPPGEIVHVINPTSDTPIVAMRDQTAFTEILLSSKMLSDHLPGVYLACLERLHLLENRRMTRQVSSGPDADNPQGDDETWLLADTISGSSRNGRSSRGLWEAVNGGAGVDPEEGVRMVTRAVTSGYSPAHVDGQHTRHRHVHHESIPEVDI